MFTLLKFRTALVQFLPALALCALFSMQAHASLRLETSVVVVEDGEGVISLKNTDTEPVLLYSEIIDVPEDTSPLLLVTPPITRVEAGDTQTVRFILKSKEKLTTERLKRAAFEGIPQSAPNKVRVNIRQNIPIIIRPAGLAANKEPWKLLQWIPTAEGLSVKNAGPYVVRMSQEVTLQPGAIRASLPKNYILPGETLLLSAEHSMSGAQKIKYTPATLNGYFTDPVETSVSGTATPAPVPAVAS
jgi:P pilus assembly chaperone PapD